MTYEEAIDRDVRTTQVEIDLDQLRNIIYRLENKILAAERRIKALENCIDNRTADIACDNCD